jgi:hypothetical protein
MRPEETQQRPSKNKVTHTMLRVICLNAMIPIFSVLSFPRFIAARSNAKQY